MDLSKIKQYLPTYKENFKSDPRWLIKESDHYIFHYFPKSIAEKEIGLIIDRQEKAFNKIIDFLEVPDPKKKISYYFYPDAETKKDLMGDNWYAQAIWKDFIIHAIYTEKAKPLGEHEDTHLLSLPWGLSIAFFQEGLAEYLAGCNWYGQNHDDVVKEALKKGILPSIESMMEHKKWLELDDNNVLYYYCFTASFTKFLIEKYGKDKFKTVYQSTSRDKTKEENCDAFLNVYGILQDEAEKEWENFIQRRHSQTI